MSQPGRNATRRRLGRISGMLSAAAAVAAAGYLLFITKISVSSSSADGLATESGTVQESTVRTTHETFHGLLAYASETPSDVLLVAWPLLIAGIALLTGAAAWTDRPPLVWVGALVLLGISVLGAMTIGFYAAPAAFFALASAVLLSASGRRERVERAVRSAPPTILEAVLKTFLGAVAVALGALLAYSGASAGLSEACAVETAACVLENTHWNRVTGTAIGLGFGVLGAWTVFVQVRSARILTQA
jgi:hypothetical protein